MNDLKLFIPFEKKDNDERIVAGYATTEALDSQGEVVKLAAIEQALPDYMKFGNIREMHQFSAVGKAIQAKVDGSKKGLYLVAKVIDDMAWKKVKEGVYNGFSIGGRILKKINNSIEQLTLSEISLVDRPANPEAIFSLVKLSDGKAVKSEDMPEETEEAPEIEFTHTGMLMVDKLSVMAADVVFILNARKSQKQEVAHFEAVLKAIKDAMMVEIKMDKLAKAEADADAKKSIQEKVEEIKNILETAKKNNISSPNWADKYFKQMQEKI
jgi:phage head maturation protease